MSTTTANTSLANTSRASRFSVPFFSVPTLIAAVAGSACAGVVVDIPPGSLPLQPFFAANPGATVNVHDGGVIIPDAGEDDAFDFNGATVNFEDGGGAGFFTFDIFMENATFNLKPGAEIVRAVFVGGSGSTDLVMTGGQANRGLKLRGNTSAVISGGEIGPTGTGAPSFHLEDTATVSMSGGESDNDAIIEDSSVFTQSGGTQGDLVGVKDSAVLNLTSGRIGRLASLTSSDAVFNVAGGTTGWEFMASSGTVNITAGGLGFNSALVNSGGDDPVLNMSGGAIDSNFRAYDGVMNVRGGAIGDRFRVGRPTGDGSGVTVNLYVKSATLDTVDLPLTPNTPVEITVRGGEFLSVVLAEDDATLGITMNQISGTEDYVRAGADLFLIWEVDCDADLVAPFGVLDLADISAFIAGFTSGDPIADLAEPMGVFDLADISAFIESFTDGCGF